VCCVGVGGDWFDRKWRALEVATHLHLHLHLCLSLSLRAPQALAQRVPPGPQAGQHLAAVRWGYHRPRQGVRLRSLQADCQGRGQSRAPDAVCGHPSVRVCATASCSYFFFSCCLLLLALVPSRRLFQAHTRTRTSGGCRRRVLRWRWRSYERGGGGGGERREAGEARTAEIERGAWSEKPRGGCACVCVCVFMCVCEAAHDALCD
jgi:hypothetical protein